MYILLSGKGRETKGPLDVFLFSVYVYITLGRVVSVGTCRKNVSAETILQAFTSRFFVALFPTQTYNYYIHCRTLVYSIITLILNE